MEETRLSLEPTSESEWQQFKNRKLMTFAILIIFIVHAMPGGYLQEIFPLTRWLMYDHGSERLQTVCRQEFVAQNQQEETYYIPYSDVFHRVGFIAGVPSRYVLLVALLADDERGNQLRNTMINRLSNLSNDEIIQAEIWESCYSVIESEQVGYIDWDNPDSRTLRAIFSRDFINVISDMNTIN